MSHSAQGRWGWRRRSSSAGCCRGSQAADGARGGGQHRQFSTQLGISIHAPGLGGWSDADLAEAARPYSKLAPERLTRERSNVVVGPRERSEPGGRGNREGLARLPPAVEDGLVEGKGRLFRMKVQLRELHAP